MQSKDVRSITPPTAMRRVRELILASNEYLKELKGDPTNIYKLYGKIAQKYNVEGYTKSECTQPVGTNPDDWARFNNELIALAHAYSKYRPGVKTGLVIIDNIIARQSTKNQFIPRYYDYLNKREKYPDISDKESFSIKAQYYFEELTNETNILILYKDICQKFQGEELRKELFALACSAYKHRRQWQCIPNDLDEYITYLIIEEKIKDYIPQEIPESLPCHDSKIPEMLDNFKSSYINKYAIRSSAVIKAIDSLIVQVEMNNICTAAENTIDPNLFLTICRNYFANFLYDDSRDIKEPYEASIIVDFLNWIAEGISLAAIFTEDDLRRVYEVRANSQNKKLIKDYQN